MSTSATLDTLLRLGDQIGEAVKADNWSLVSELVKRRTEVAQQLSESDGPADEEGFSERGQKKIEALAEQNQRLTGLLRERRGEIEEELAQIGELKHAQNSYEANSTGGGVLPSTLEG